MRKAKMDVGDDRDRQKVDRQRQLCVSVGDRPTETHISSDRQVQDQLVATEQSTVLKHFVCIKLLWLCLSMFVPPSIKFVFYAYLILNT